MGILYINWLSIESAIQQGFVYEELSQFFQKQLRIILDKKIYEILRRFSNNFRHKTRIFPLKSPMNGSSKTAKKLRWCISQVSYKLQTCTFYQILSNIKYCPQFRNCSKKIINLQNGHIQFVQLDLYCYQVRKL